MIDVDDPGYLLYHEIGKRIRYMRRHRDLSQAELAEGLGLTRTSITNIEAGRQRAPVDLIYDIADALKVQVFDLLPDNKDV